MIWPPGGCCKEAGRAYNQRMSMRLSAIHFLVTYRCTYECDHCFVWGGPQQEATMTLAQLQEVIDQAAACGLETVYFEGGEPMLAYPVVLAAARHARARGLDWGLVTNCFWATSVEDAQLWLAPFVELEIADLSVSSYPCSTEEIGEQEQLRDAALAARELGLPLSLLEVGAAACLPGLEALCGEPGSIMYRGRAAVELAPEAATRPPHALTSCPYEDLEHPERAHLGADGELQVCQGISAGNVFTRGLAAVMAGYEPQRTPVVRELLHGGPWELARACGVEPALAAYADECHLCYEVRTALRSRYPDVLAPDAVYGVTG